VDFQASSFKQSKIVIAFISVMASLYISNVSIMLLQPVLLFSAFLLCLISLIESFANHQTSVLIRGLYTLASALAAYGFWLSYELIQQSSRIVEYIQFLH